MERHEAYEMLELVSAEQSATHRLQNITDYLLDQLGVIQFCEHQEVAYEASRKS